MMSRDTLLAVLGTVAFMVWAVISALSVQSLALRVVLATTSVAIPLTLWWVAARLRAKDSGKAQNIVLWTFSAEFIVMVVVDTVRWLVESDIR